MGKISAKTRKKIIIRLYVFLGILIVLGIAILFGYDMLSEYSNKGNNLKDEVNVSLSSTDEINQVAKKLKKAGLIKYEFLFKFKFDKADISRRFIDGDLQLSKGMNYSQIIEKIVEPPKERSTITIRFREGSEVKDIVNTFVENGIGTVDGFNEVINTFNFNYDFIAKPGVENRLEGYLFPDTYEFFSDVNEREALEKLIKGFRNKIGDKEVWEKIQASGKSLSEIVIMASLIEKESGNVADMPSIASVFYNRLKKEMLLQSCATFNYTVPKTERENRLTTVQMEMDIPYNTYLYKGLPPTPIANPGIDAILAAISPAKTSYLYFCAKGNGFSAFATTLSGHESNVNKYKENW